MKMQADIRIMNGKILDPALKEAEQGEVLIKNGHVMRRKIGEEVDAAQTVDASGCIVTPGLIDYHAHLFFGGTDGGVSADTSLLPMGVTTAVDVGSCGAANYESFVQAMSNQRMRIYTLLHVSSSGIVTGKFMENIVTVFRLLERDMVFLG